MYNYEKEINFTHDFQTHRTSLVILGGEPWIISPRPTLSMKSEIGLLKLSDHYTSVKSYTFTPGSRLIPSPYSQQKFLCFMKIVLFLYFNFNIRPIDLSS